MGDMLRLAFGVMGNAASLLLYTAPILTFSRVIKKKSTEGFSCLPYVLTMLSCLIYTWYGFPIVSYRWENFPLCIVNGLGIFLEISFIIIYFWFASAKEKIKVGVMVIAAAIVICTTAIVSTFAFHDHQHRKAFVGSIGLVACVAMYSSPLIAVRQVIRTKSVEFMPFYLSFFSFLASSLWMAYGILSHDLFLTSPSIVGSPLGIIQLLLYFKYRKRGVMEEPNEEKSKQLQLVVDDKSNGNAKNIEEGYA